MAPNSLVADRAQNTIALICAQSRARTSADAHLGRTSSVRLCPRPQGYLKLLLTFVSALNFVPPRWTTPGFPRMCYFNLRWLEIVSWRARPGSLIARARASTPGSRRCKFSDLVPSKILQNLYFDRKYLGKLTVKICKIFHSGKERTEISVLIERKNSVRSKQNERESRII